MQPISAASMELNQSMIDQLSDGFIRIQPDGSISYSNQKVHDWFGEPILQHNIHHFIEQINVFHIQQGKWLQTEWNTPLNTAHIKVCSYQHPNGVIDLLVRKMEDDHDADQPFNSLFYQNDVPILMIDLEGTILEVNWACLQILSYDRNQLNGKHLTDIFATTNKADAKQCLQQINEGNIFTQDIHMESKMGERIEFQFTHIPYYTNGQLDGAYCVARNNSELRRAQEALLESEQRYRQLVEHSPDPVCLHDSEKIIYLNDVAAMLLGVEDKDALIGQDISRYIHMEDYNDSMQRINKVMEGTRVEQLFPLKIVRPDGVVLEMEGKSIPIKENGKTYVLAVFRDVTEKNHAKRSLQQSERRYRSLFLHNPDGIYSINLNGELTSINPAIVKITGFTAKEQIGLHYSDFILPEDWEQTKVHYKNIFEGKTVKFEKRMLRKDGKTISVRVVGFPMIVENEIVGMYGILRDITEEKRSEELLRRSEKLTVVGELAAAVAHEIRNPLTSIKGFIQMMENGVPEKDLYYQIVLSELNRIEQIISEMLVLAKPQSVCFQRKKIGHLIRHVLKLLEGQANLHNIQFIVDFEGDDLEIDCEENQLKQVFINLIKNSIEVMQDGGKIIVTCRKTEDDQLLIRVIDQGPGIPEDRLSRLGEPFYTTKEKGTGLGLMVSFKIIKDHKGTMHFSSVVGEGTTVDVLLPLPSS
ncbi:PAS domain S-box protein [Pseudalkalibacillus sp. Hm43]|uniref:PAS domain-containing sensor histidine kinase n=1 Tax=Pseudalkalibacillus sp. Hm43 TaxID=3450742 RepID=UPI003F42A937